MFKILKINLALLISALVFIGAKSKNKEAKFSKSIYLSTNRVKLDTYKNFSAPCQNFLKKQGSVAFFRESFLNYKKELTFKFECKTTQTNKNVFMSVYENNKKLTSFKNAVSSTEDGGFISQTNIWLVDLDKDKHLDLIRRKKSRSKNVFTGEILKTDDQIEKYYWNEIIRKFVLDKPDSDKVDKLKANYNFKLPD